MIRVYHTDEGIRAVTGIWQFESLNDEALQQIRMYKSMKKSHLNLDFAVEFSDYEEALKFSRNRNGELTTVFSEHKYLVRIS